MFGDRGAGLVRAAPVQPGQVREALATGGRLAVAYPGVGRDSGPTCATVKLPGDAWRVGVEQATRDGSGRGLELAVGALATSGDARRFLLRQGVRYPHILNPRTGWPVMRAPRSVTVLGEICLEAGLLATLAMLEGERAEEFLAAQGVRHWVQR